MAAYLAHFQRLAGPVAVGTGGYALDLQAHDSDAAQIAVWTQHHGGEAPLLDAAGGPVAFRRGAARRLSCRPVSRAQAHPQCD